MLLDFGSWKSHAATRKNDDGTISLYTIDPSVDGFEFVIGTKAAKRTLAVRDGQQDTRLAAERGAKTAYAVKGHSCDEDADDSGTVTPAKPSAGPGQSGTPKPQR